MNNHRRASITKQLWLQLTKTALPLLDPPAECALLTGLSTGAFAVVKLLPDRQRSSQVAFPSISPPKYVKQSIKFT